MSQEIVKMKQFDFLNYLDKMKGHSLNGMGLMFSGPGNGGGGGPYMTQINHLKFTQL